MQLEVTPVKTGKGGFTLIELLVVVAIIGILAALLLPVFTKVRARAKIATTKGVIGELETAIRAYYDDNTEFPKEDDVNTPTVSMFYQITNYGHSAPYTKKGRFSDLEEQTATRIVVRDPWWATTKNNFIRYARAPMRSDNAAWTETAWRTELTKFFGNDRTFNIWSWGPNLRDDSSDQANAAVTYPNSGGDEATDPNVTNGIYDDVANWSKFGRDR